MLQALHLVDVKTQEAKRLHALSLLGWSSVPTPRVNGGGATGSGGSGSSSRPLPPPDLSWPFMCVSIMFTKEALQALRRGTLNVLANERGGDVLGVLHDFHHACFHDFAV